MTHDTRVERQTLGALMLGDPTDIATLATLTDRDFHDGRHITIFQAIRTCATTHGRADPVRVRAELEATGRLTAAGGDTYLVDTYRCVTHTASLPLNARHVIQLARRRRIITGATQLAKQAADPTINIDDVLHETVDQLVADRDSSGLITPNDLAESVLEIHEDGRDSRSVPTGWAPLDRIWRLAPGMLTILAGHPGHGKSSWVDALVVVMARTRGWRSCLYAPESAPSDDHAARMVQTWTRRRFESLKPSEVVQALDELDDRVVWVDHDLHTTPAAILAQATAAHADKPINLLLIDPWSEVEAIPERGQREDMLIGAELTRIRRWARRHSVHVIVAAHPRQVDRQADGTLPVPNSQILHGGAVWRRKADSLIAVWRDDDASTRPEELVDIHVQKVRRNGVDGQMGRVAQLRFDLATGQYHALSHLEAVP